MFTLRPYQQETVDAIYQHLRERDDNPCGVVPTAGGKTYVLATICRDVVQRWSGRVLVLAHVKELLEQAVEKLELVAPDIADQIGVYSAGLKRRDTKHPVLVAGIQSVYKRACELDAFDLIIIDEAHMIPTEGDGMYRTFLNDAMTINPRVRAIGLTATPFRMKTGMICKPNNILNHICYDISVRELILDGYLCPLVTKAGRQEVDTSILHVRYGEFIQDEAEALMDRDELVQGACEEIITYTKDRSSCLVFATSVKHGKHIAEVLRSTQSAKVGTVFGSTLTNIRDQTLEDFRAGLLKYLVNVNVLTTGFDAPNIDCVALVRPTLSPGLYYQMVGRGFRLHPGKENCLVLDFGGNVLRHGPVDRIKVTSNKKKGNGNAPVKVCPGCQSVVAAGFRRCPDCGYEFPPPERQRHERKATTAGVLSGQVTSTKYEVTDVYFSVHTKRGASPEAPKTMRVDYQIGFNQYQSEWVCFEHTGLPRHRAATWWQKRSDAPLPHTAEDAVYWAKDGMIAPTRFIVIRRITGEKYARIIGYEVGDKPPYREPGWEEEQIEAEGAEYTLVTKEELPF